MQVKTTKQQNQVLGASGTQSSKLKAQSYSLNSLNFSQVKRILPYFSKMVFLFSIFFYFTKMSAQLIGWPTSSSNQEIDQTTIAINSTEYMDNDRAKVKKQTLVSTSPDVYDLELTSVSGASFVANKWCAVIQMSGSGVGANCLVKTISYNSGTDVMRIQVLSGNTWPTYDFTTNARVQLVRVPVYWDLTMNTGAHITCHPFDYASGTGGVLPLIVGGTITINGGFFNVSNLGYKNDWVGGTPDLGIGGAGANWLPYGINTINGVAWSAGRFSEVRTALIPNGNICYNGLMPIPAIPTFANGNFGENGDEGNNTGLLGTNTNTSNELIRYPLYPTNSFYNTVLRMGNGGFAGVLSGTGGGGGGAGGRGGTNGIAPFGTYFGTNKFGLAGGKGGDANLGGNGGGVMYLKFANSVIDANIINTTGYKLFFAKGENGKSGEQGENGGDGGEASIGQNGACSGLTSLATTGGWGGAGESGKGAGGGSGGNGGQPGTVWIVKKQPGTHYSNFKRFISVKGGKGGGAGRGGYSKIYLSTPRADNYAPALNRINYPCLAGVDYSLCPPVIPPSPNYIYCDCDKVYEHWGTEGASGYTVDATTDPNNWKLTFNNLADPIYFDPNTKYLSYSTGNITYNCFMVESDVFVDIMKKAFKVIALETYSPPDPSNGNIVGTNFANYNIGSNITDIKLNTTKTMEYDPATKRLTDFDDPARRYVEAQNCDITYGNHSIGGGGGGGGGEPPVVVPVRYDKTGDDGQCGGDEPDGDEYDNMGEENGGDKIMPHKGDGELEGTVITTKDIAKIKDANQKLSIELLDNELGNWDICKLYSIDGKLLETQKIEDGKTQFNPQKTGVYVLVFSGNGRNFSQKVLLK